MIKKENYWIDDFNNKWDSQIYTKEQAKKFSSTLSSCENCINCSDCSSCRYCRYCSSCKNYKSNPQRYLTSNIGSRNAQTAIYWIDENIQIICGCFKGDLKQFEERVKSVHTGKFLEQYLKEIEIFKYLTGQGGPTK